LIIDLKSVIHYWRNVLYNFKQIEYTVFNMRKSTILDTTLLIIVVLMCLGAATVKVKAFEIEWTSPTNATLFFVDMIDASTGVAVGADGTAIRWDGTNWNTMIVPTEATLYSFSIVSLTDVWIVGENGTIIRWNGLAYNIEPSPTNLALYSVDMVSADDGWAVGENGAIIHWDGFEWIPEFPTSVIMPLLVSLTLVVVILRKATLRKLRKLST
jgi:hypothetical protein